MINFTLNPNEMKREIYTFCSFLTKNVNKPRKKFVLDMMYGLAYSKSCLLSDIARALKEKNELCNGYAHPYDSQRTCLQHSAGKHCGGEGEGA